MNSTVLLRTLVDVIMCCRVPSSGCDRPSSFWSGSIQLRLCGELASHTRHQSQGISSLCQPVIRYGHV